MKAAIAVVVFFASLLAMVGFSPDASATDSICIIIADLEEGVVRDSLIPARA